MKRIFFILFFVPAFCNAQTWQELEDSLNYYYQQSDLDKGILIAGKMVDHTAREQGKDNSAYATALNNLAFMQQKAGDKNGAMKNYLQSMIIRRKLLPADHADCFNSVQSLSDLYKETGSMQEALGLLNGYLGDLEPVKKRAGKIYTYTLFLRADTYIQSGQSLPAEKDLLQVLTSEKELESDSVFWYHTYSLLADIYSGESSLEKAERVFIRHAELCRALNGPESSEFIYAQYRLAGLYSRAGQYQQAIRYLLEVQRLYLLTEGIAGKSYRTVSLQAISLLGKTGNHTGADSLARYLMELVGREKGDSSSAYDEFRYEIANSLKLGGSLDQSAQFLEQSIRYNTSANNRLALVTRLYDLDTVYKLQKRFEDRKTVLEKIRELQDQYQLLGDSAYAIRLVSLAEVYSKLQDMFHAGQTGVLLDSVSRRAFDKNNELYLISRQVIANLYMITERLDIAELYYQEALSLAPNLLKQLPDEYAALLKVTGEMYITAGQYNKATKLLNQARDLLESSKTNDLPLLASVYYQLYSSLRERSRQPEAEAALRKAVLLSASDPEQRFNHIAYSGMLAMYYRDMKLYSQADSLYKHKLELTNFPGTAIYSRYLTTLAQQAYNSLLWGKKEMAAELINAALTGSRKYYRDSLQWDSDLTLFISEYFRLNGEYSKAITYSRIMLKQEEKKYGNDNPGLISTYVILIQLFLEARDYYRAEDAILSLNRITRKGMTNGFEMLSESEKEKYLANKVFNLHLFNTLLFRKRDVSASFIGESLNQALLMKSLILSESRQITESLLQSADTSLQRLYRQWQLAKQALSKEYAKPVSSRNAELDKMEERTEELEKTLNRKSPYLQQKKQAASISYTDIQQGLAPDEAAIEFVNFGLFGATTDSSLYAAYIIKKNSRLPIFVPLCEKRELQKILDSAGITTTSMVSKFYRGTELKSKNTTTLGAALYKLVWQPLAPYLEGIRKISYAPAGKLYSIAFHALPTDSNRILMDQFQLQQYSSIRQVALRKETGTSAGIRDIILFGDARFTLDSIKMAHTGSKRSTNLYLPEQRGGQEGTWVELPGTAEEVTKIRDLFVSNRRQATSYTQADATEESLKAMSGQAPQVLHIATHGFFLPDFEQTKTITGQESKQEGYSLAKDPLLRSGLIFAGANYVWSGKAPIEGLEDGIATAYEISQLNLSGTELVVLSACETALGDVKGSEGVFGLQRAFKMAGVKKMIVSLWQVPDKETADLMTAFYSYWLKGKRINEAFAQAQAEMRKKYSPYYWAAFVLVE